MHIQNLFGRKKLILIIFFLTILAVSVNAIYPYITKIVIDNVLIGKNVLLMRNIILGLGLIIIIQVLVDFFLSYLSSVWVQKNISDIRNLIFDRFLKIDPFSTNKNGQTLIISDAEVIAANVQSILLTSLNSGLSIIVFGVIAFTISPLLTLVILSALPIFVLANIKLSSISKDKFFETQHSKDELLSKLTDFLSGKIFIKIYHAELYAKSELVNLNKQLKNNSISLSTVMIMVKDVLAILTSVTPFIVLSIGMGLSLNHQISTGGLIAIYTYAGMIFSPVSNLVNLMPAYQQIIVALERINNYLVLEPEGAAITTKLHDNSNKKVTLVNNINLVKNDVPILKNMTLNMDNEHIYMLTGPNGSGKSMLGKILTGLIFPSSGNIYNKNINTCLYVPADNYLFDGSLKFNLTIGLDSYSNCELNTLVTKLNLVGNKLSFNSRLDNSKHTLSTGQIQKIKFIRAILEHPDFLVLDEILENMDLNSRNIAIEIIKENSDETIFLVISHNLFTNLLTNKTKLIEIQNSESGSVIRKEGRII